MTARTAIRLAMTAFTAVVLSLTAIGIKWTHEHQPPAGALASATVLSISSAFSIVALVVIWRRTDR
jgi:hypothetical protein